uniref:Myb-like domain-containing protein n=1 Tax=Brassica oleracea var. oleracea TaxID=109376 RepID=A0A0D3BQS5_BRAOL
MEKDYSYNQPSSSDEYDITSLLQAEAEMYADEAESSYNIAEPVQYPPQPEADDGIPTTCYCGGEPVVATSYTPKDPGRRKIFKGLERECLTSRVSDLASVCKSNTEHSLTMDTTHGYVNLLNSQSSVDFDSPEPAWFSSQCPDESSVKERRKWSSKEDIILIGAWLNTSKDSIVSNEKKAGAFWKRIVEYYNSSPLLVGTTPRELGQCKQRWARINDLVCKFNGCYEMALREQRSVQNDNDVMKAALDIFHSDQNMKFNLEHAWRELRHDVKWCSTYLEKDNAKDKRKPVDFAGGAVPEPEERPIGVKAASKRKKTGKSEELAKLEGLSEIKKQISKQSLLECLLAKPEPLSEMELALKMKLMSEMM